MPWTKKSKATDYIHMAAIFLSHSGWEAQISYCCVQGCKSFKHSKSYNLLSFNHLLIDQQLKRRWTVIIQRDIGSYMKVKQHA